jgi:predicted adenine nucleotide alpha hydrolase (AANH) superfamily ATPase
MLCHAQMWSGSPRKLDATCCKRIHDYRFINYGRKSIFRGTETFVTSLLMTKFREQNHLNNEAISWHAILFK